MTTTEMGLTTEDHDAPDEPSRESSLRVETVSKSFRHVQALSDVSLRAERGEVLGLVGENGAGKSTLLNILTGVFPPDSGTIYVDDEEVSFSGPQEAAEYGISLVHQEQDVLPNLRGYENLFLGRETGRFGILDRSKMREEAQAFVDELGMNLDVEKYVRNYTFNERQMLEIARAFYVSRHSDHPVILLDEPTAGLEEDGRELLFERINDLRNQATFVFVSHELDEVLDITDRIYVLKDGERVADYETANATTDDLQRSMVGRETSTEYYQIPDQLDASELGEPCFEVDGLTLEEELGPVSFSLREGEILGVVGVEGSGKERLGRMLAGDIAPTDGVLHVDGDEVRPTSPADMVDAGVGYIPKDRKQDGLLLFQSVLKNTSLAMVRDMNGDLPLLDLDSEEDVTAEMIEELNIKTPGPRALVHGLSGGNQQKVVIARWLARETPIIVMDNVTRGIDVGAKEEVYRLCRGLTAQGFAIVFIGDELPEVIGMSNRIVVMKEGQLVGDPVDASAGAKPTEENLIQRMI